MQIPTRISKKYVDEFFIDLNSLRPSIQFTVEIEKDGCLSLLVTFVPRNLDGSLDISVYHKGTHTDRYFIFYSHPPNHVNNA